MQHIYAKIHSQLLPTLIAKSATPRPAAEMATLVKNLSEKYIARTIDLSLIWADSRYAEAYLTYFMPLNLLRILAVIQEGKARGFFAGLEHVIDFGSGPGTFHFAALEESLPFKSWNFIEKSLPARQHHQRIWQSLTPPQSKPEPEVEFKATPPNQILSNTLSVFSYSLNELSELPDWALKSEGLLIVEPSTADQGRKLQETRAQLIAHGFSIWAPCTHNAPCPLLTHSKTDWCHNRIHVELPPTLTKLETLLPMKNKTLTYSYILARKTAAPKTESVRLIGDTLFERGKTKQAICRGPEREFLTWLTRYGEPEPLDRGGLFTLPIDILKKGSELRMPPPLEIKD